jgi:hypothetical protein
MPINPGSCFGVYFSQFPLLNGPIGRLALSKAAADATSAFLVGSTEVVTKDVGTLGQGAGTGVLFLPAALSISVISRNFKAAKLLGPIPEDTARGLATGFSICVSIGLAQTIHPTVGVGTASVNGIIPKFSAVPICQGAFSAALLNGQEAKKMAAALGAAMDELCSSIVGQLVIAGSPSPIPSGGAGYGKII